MANEEDGNKSATDAEAPQSNDKGLLTTAARVIGGAIGKVSSKLHIVEAPSRKPVRKPGPAKKSAVKKSATKKTAQKNAAPTSKKSTAKKTAQARKPVHRSAK